jgi:hypothetical protein
VKLGRIIVMRQKTTIRNSSTVKIVLHIEPWGDELALLPNKDMEIEFDGPEDGHIVVVYEIGHISIYGWHGSNYLSPQ